MKKFFPILLCLALARENFAADVVFNLSALGISPVTNRAVLFKPEWLNPTNSLGLPDTFIQRTGTNGSTTLTNCPEAILNIEIMGPPSRMIFSIYVPQTNITLYAADLRGQGTGGRLDPNRYSWSVRASDGRYARPGDAGKTYFFFNTNLTVGVTVTSAISSTAVAVWIGTNTAGQAIAWAQIGDGNSRPDGLNYGTQFGTDAKGTNAGSAFGNGASAVIAGAAFGESANGDNSGVAIGQNSKGYDSGIAIGLGADGHGSGNIAIGDGYYGGVLGVTLLPTSVPDGFTETVVIGSGLATLQGALHFRSFPIVDTNGVHIGDASGITNIPLTALQTMPLTNGGTYGFSNAVFSDSFAVSSRSTAPAAGITPLIWNSNNTTLWILYTNGVSNKLP